MGCFIQRGNSRVEWNIQSLPNENILTIARIKTFIICMIIPEIISIMWRVRTEKFISS